MRERRIRRRSRPQLPLRVVNNMYEPDNVSQYFQISVNVLEARELVWSNPQAATSFVMVVLGRKKHRTTIRRNQEEPNYKEHLVFDMYMTVREIQRSSLWLAVMEPRWCAPPKTIGEATLDLGTVWAQPNHQVYHKWVQLGLPRDPNANDCVGFLKVDISIIFRGEVQVMPAIPTILCDEKIDEHLVCPTGSEQQRAKYLVTIHAGFSLPSCVLLQNDKRFGKQPSTYVRVSFSGLVGKTSVQHQTTDPNTTSKFPWWRCS
ncbi:c2 domain-containing protein [Phthorimaea operculella]|nr:c2 domain-containing protein [Phthorimaea operculella]